MSPDNTLDQHVVTAVVVAHDGAGWIPRMAEGVLQQTRPVQRAVAVDTGSRDRSGAMLAGLFGRGAVFGMDRGTGYAAAVSHALRHRAANTRVPGSGERTEWVWLIHDDCEPAPDALEQLLQAANETPSAAVFGPKVMDWTDKRVILEAGVAIDVAGRRVTGLEPREVDQGQHDGDRDVLAVSTAGMLIRRDVWDQLGGFDTGMRLFREDVDFCWRAQAAGHRIRLVTGAVVYHLEASARNRRQTSAAPRPRREDRRNALTMLAGNLPGGAMLRMLVGNTVLSLLRTVFYLVAKRPGAGADEFTALLAVAGHPLRVLSARRPRARGRRAAYGRLRAMMPPARTLGRLFEFIAAALSKSSPVDTIGSHHATEDPSDDDSLLVDSGFVQRILTSPGVLLFLALTTITLVAERSVLGGGPLGGGDLTPAWGGASGLWQEYLQGFHPVGVGSAASTPPYVAVIAFVATLLLGKTWLAVDVLLIGSVPLAGLTAYLAAGRITRFPPARVWAAAAYALLPVGMGAVAAGRLAAAVVFALLPVVAVLAARMFTQPRRRARRAAWAMALVTAVAAAFVPLVWLAVAALVGLGGLIFARSRPGIGLNLVIVAAVPPALLLPWSLQLATNPAMFLLESGLQQPGLSQPALPARSLLLLSPGGPGLPPYWVTGGLLAAALVAVLASGRRPAVMAGWGVALAGLLGGIGVSRLVVTPPGGGPAVPAWPGPMLAFAGAGLVLAAAAAGDSLRIRLGEGRWRSPAGLGLVLVGLVACSAPLLAAATWVITGVSGPLSRAAGPVLPEFVSVASADGMQPRTLVLEPGARGTVSYEVLRGADPLIGEPGLTPAPAASRALATTVADLVAPGGGEAQDQGRALAGFGIGYVLLPSPGSPAMARLLDGVAGLRPVSQTTSFQLWRVTGTVARVRVIEAGGKTVPVPSGPVGTSGAAPPAGGELVLAEPAGGWSASLNGQPLTPMAPAGGWAQAFRLPAGGGTLTIGHSQLGRDALVLLQCLAVLAVAALGLPGARVSGEEAGEAAGSRPAGSRTRGRTDARPAGRRSRAGQAVPEPRAAGPEETGDRLAGQAAATGLLAAGPGQDPAAGGRGHAVSRDGAPASRDYPVGGGLAPLPAAGGPPEGGPPGGGRAGARSRRGPAADAPGRRPGKRSGGLLGRARPGRGAQDAAAASATGPAGDGPRSGRGRRGRPDNGDGGDGYPGDPHGSAPYPGDGGGRRAAAGNGAAGGDYGTGGAATGGYPSGEFRGGDYGTGGYGAGDYGTGGYSTGGYGAGDYGAGAGGTGGYGAGDYGTGGYSTGGYGAGDYGTGGYSAGGKDTGGYGAGEGRDDDARGRGRAGRGGGDRGDAGQGRAGRRGRGKDSGGSDGRGGRILGRRGRGDSGRDGDGRDRDGRGGESRGRARGGRGRDGQDRGSGGNRGDYGNGGYGRGDYPAGGYPAGGYPAGDYRTGEFGAGGPSGGYPAGDYRTGEYDAGRYETGGYPAGDYGSGEYRTGAGRDGYGTGGSGAGDYPGGYPAGDYRTGEYDAGRYETGGYPAGDYGTGGYGDGDAAGSGGGRKHGSGGRGKPGRGKSGRRPGRGNR